MHRLSCFTRSLTSVAELLSLVIPGQNTLKTSTVLVQVRRSKSLQFHRCASHLVSASENARVEEACLPHMMKNEIQNITGGDIDLEKKLKVLILEHEVYRQDGIRVPTTVKPSQWKELLSMDTRSKRKKFFKFLWLTEKRKENEKRKKEEKKLAYQQSCSLNANSDDENGHIQYGLHNNTMFLRIYEKTMNSFYNNKLIQAMQFSQPIVLDCNYDQHMTRQECQNCANQAMLLFAENRLHSQPFNIYLCNAKRDSSLMTKVHKFFPPLYDDDFPLNVTEKSYLDIFPKDSIVYLTPHCREELLDYDHDAVYIIGAMVDKSNNEPLSLAKAKKEGLKVAKLPIDRYLDWGSGGGKSLTLNQMIQIMLEIRATGDWMKALRFVPQRKLQKEEYKPRFGRSKARRQNSSVVYNKKYDASC